MPSILNMIQYLMTIQGIIFAIITGSLLYAYKLYLQAKEELEFEYDRVMIILGSGQLFINLWNFSFIKVFWQNFDN